MTRKIIKDPVERFWNFVDIPNNKDLCWEWAGRKNYKGYGDIKGRKALGENNGKSKLTKADVENIIILFGTGLSCAEIARRYSRPHSTIYAVRVGRSWSWLSE